MSVFCFVVSTICLRYYRIRQNRLYRRYRAGKVLGGGIQADYQLDLDGGVEWELGDANGAPGVQAGVPEDLPEKLGGAVEDPWLAVEAGGRGHEARHLDYVAQVVEAAGPLRRGGPAGAGGGARGPPGAPPR